MANLMSDPNHGSAIVLSKAQEVEISKLDSTDAIREYLHQVALDQKLVQRVEGDDPYYLNPVEPGTVAAAKSLVRVLQINGQKTIVEGATEEELNRNELAALKTIINGGKAIPQEEEQPRNPRGQFTPRTADQEAAAALAPSVVEALRQAGLNPEALQAYSATHSPQAIHDAWESASAEFRTSDIGKTWPGGVEARNLLGQAIEHLGLTDTPTAATLTKAFQYLIDTKQIFTQERAAYEKGVSESTNFEDLKRRAGYQDVRFANQLWER
jgi:hypothetical protein